ncbi:hypothetical protein PVAP13_1KG116877 [Panicum virgatum]|uniref:Uncharacterized protein n=1 Tax=Panicum virgatum TaxID=38727 RepID=A0A8T0X5X3_PANVG|nr:hypothetical protein PVAP13_1KG116877 [Panicum virgatum]
MRNSSLGIGPVSLLCERYKISKGQQLRLEGMAPLRALPSRPSLESTVKLPRVTGIEPYSLLSDSASTFNFLRLPIDNGIFVSKRLLSMPSAFKPIKFPMLSGIFPYGSSLH